MKNHQTHKCPTCGEYYPNKALSDRCCSATADKEATHALRLQAYLDSRRTNPAKPLSFTQMCAEYMERERDLLGVKAADYATKHNRMANFDRVAAVEGRESEEVCLTYMLKHIDAILVAVSERKVKWCWQDERGNEGTMQRIVDARNYLLLLAALLERKHNGTEIVG